MDQSFFLILLDEEEQIFVRETKSFVCYANAKRIVGYNDQKELDIRINIALPIKKGFSVLNSLWKTANLAVKHRNQDQSQIERLRLVRLSIRLSIQPFITREPAYGISESAM